MTKITIDRSVVEQALEAMDEIIDADDWLRTSKARVALRQALQQPNEFTPDWDQIKPFNDRIAELEKVVKQALDALDPPEHLRFGGTGKLKTAALTALRQALSATHGEQPAQQEPVAIRWKRQNYGWVYEDYKPGLFYGKGVKAEHLYTTPQVIDKSAAIRIATALGWEPRREWVGLTDEEIIAAMMPVEEQGQGYFLRLARAIEAKLKEKNT